MDFSPPYCFCFSLLLLLPFSTNGQTLRNISLGSSLTAANDNSLWTSPSGDFAFGFQQIADDGFLLAIWFNKIPQKTIVWSANRNILVQRGSTVQLTTDGQLVLNNHLGSQIWSTRFNESVVAYAAMLDTGNFVLASPASVNLWQSFDHPTDTMLPTQNLNLGGELIAPYLERNYSDGRFKFILQSDGNILLYTTNYPYPTNNSAYWPAESSINGSGYKVIYNQSGYMYLTAINGTIVYTVFSGPVSMQDFYQRATLDYDGVFRQYVYPKTPAASRGRAPMTWTTFSPSIPSNICLSIRAEKGSGACGYNSYCSYGDDQRPRCQCPPGYTLLDPNDEWKGCKQNFISQDCDQPSEGTDSFDFRDLPNTDWPENDYEFFNSVDEDWCRQACLSDCYCAVANVWNKMCWMKRLPLSNGRTDPSVGGKALMKVRKGNSTTGSSTKKNDGSTLVTIGAVLLGSSVFVLSLLGIYVFFSHSKRRKPKIVQFQQNTMSNVNPRSFSYNELETVTGGFTQELGTGAFGTVYKGFLSKEEKPLIAVKKFEKMAGAVEQEFETEVRVIGRTNHKNLVQLIGFCNDGHHRLLVYEYMSNGSLANFLFGDPRPNWYRRMQIAFGVARGLLYLHEECSFQIIHSDIKPQNILLDESLEAKISDFGLAKLLKRDQSKTTRAKGYVAPEWYKNMPVTTKVDIYSFGVLLLELVCCRKNFEINVMQEDQIVLADWAYDCFKEGKLQLLVEKDEEAKADMKMVERFVMVAIWCIQEDPSLRPGMKKVDQMLEGAVQVSIPPDPASFISAI